MLNDEETALRDAARRFAQEQLAPRGHAWDNGADVPAEVFEKIGGLGYFGLLTPEQWGGSSGGLLNFVLVMEEIAAGNAGLSTLLHVHALGTAGPIVRFGSAEQKRAWLPRMASGEAIGCVCLTEPGTGSDVAAIRTTARRT